MPISIIDHSRKLTSVIVGKFIEEIPVRSGFSEWFPQETTPSLEVDVEVQRDNDLIAVDVTRFTEGNKNKFSRATEHKYIPPYFKEDYDLQRDQIYMNTIGLGSGMDNPQINSVIYKNAIKNIGKNKSKIIRAIRKMQADVLQTGIVTLVNGDNINYGRKASSMVVAPVLWSSVTTAKPIDDLRNGMTFLRNIGNSNGAAVNVVMRGDAFAAFIACDQITKQGVNVIEQIQRINVGMPQFTESTGFALQGRIAAGDFVVNLWTYNEKYTDANGATQFYLAINKVIMLPDDFAGKTVFGGLPTLNTSTVGGVSVDVPAVVEADFLIRSYSDKRTISSTIELTSAPLVIPFTIDKIYTLQVL